MCCSPPRAGRNDLRAFVAHIRGDARHFQALTYQELFARMERSVGAEHADYMAYLKDRYLSE